MIRATNRLNSNSTEIGAQQQYTCTCERMKNFFFHYLCVKVGGVNKVWLIGKTKEKNEWETVIE